MHQRPAFHGADDGRLVASLMWTDLRHAWRALRRAPGFTVVAVVVLTLGIGASTAMFSVVDAVVLKALPFDDESRLVSVLEVTRSTGRPGPVAPQNFLDWGTRTSAIFEDLGTFGRSAFTAADPELRGVEVRGVSASLLRALRVKPALGAVFTEEQEREGFHRVLLVSDALWRKRFNADQTVIGKTLQAADGPWQIVGVFAPEFGYPSPQPGTEFVWHPYVPLREDADRNSPSKAYFLTVIGRLAPGVSVQDAQTAMAAVTADLAKAHPAWFDNRSSTVMPLRDWLVGDAGPAMRLLLASVTVLLLIACANVANLVLARATTRARDIAVRTALGASQWTITRGLLAEGLLLSTMGAAMGVLVAWWSVNATESLLPPSLFRLSEIALNTRVLTMAVATSVATGVAFGLLPAWQHTRAALSTTLVHTGSGGTSGTNRRRLRSGLMVAEVALALVLLVGASLFLASFAKVMRLDMGFDYDTVSLVRVNAILRPVPPEERATERLRAAAVVEDARRAVTEVPGVESVAFMGTGGAPLSGGSAGTSLRVVGQPPRSNAESSVEIKAVSANYFDAMGMTMLRGDGLTSDGPAAAGQSAIVISDLAVQRFFGDADPIGQAVQTGDGTVRTVTGVVKGSRVKGPEGDVVPEVFLPISPAAGIAGALVVRTRRGAVVAPAQLKAAAEQAGAVRVGAVQPLVALYDNLLKPRRLNTLLVAIFGGLALAIATVGIYGVMSYVVAQRTREVGVRMALGAQPADVRWSILKEASGLLALGIVIGTAAAAMMTSIIAAFLFQVEPEDPWLYAAAVAVLAATGLLAALIPAIRASRVDPIIALR